uniref:Uncharacterized protein n=1 Tax=Dicentrarchus labrax TaxID=13489 RepID=E6ZF76_DICLA|nr:Uncharacterized protein [Dicentrarchus labrax]
MVHITANHCLFTFICLCGLGLMHSSPLLSSPLLSSPLLSSVNPSISLPDSGHDRGHLLSDPSGKRTSCHPLGQEEQPRALEQSRPNLPVQVCGRQHRLQEPEERSP